MPKKNLSPKRVTRKSVVPKAASPTRFDFEQAYPIIAEWINEQGWVEIGMQDDFSGSFIRALDPGGMVWEGKFSYPSINDALRALENGLKKWREENG